MTVSEELEFDVSSAISSINDLEASSLDAASSIQSALSDAFLNVADFAGGVAVDISNDFISAIDEVSATPITLQADTGAIDSAIASIDDLTSAAESVPEVTIEVDSSSVDEAAASLENLDTSADAAAGGVSSVGDAADNSGLQFAGAGALAEQFSGKISAMTGLSTGGAIAGGALAATIFLAGDAAADAADAQDLYNRSLGSMRGTLDQIDVLGLNQSLSDLAISLGSSDEGLKIATARLVDFAKTSGAAPEQIAKTTEEIIALAARAVALNPSLGSIDEAVIGLSAGLARGSRALRQYNLDISSAEIVTRALADTGKSSAAELTLFEKQAAGAAIAVERLGDVSGDVAAAQQRFGTRLKETKEQFGEFLEALGKPLLPIISAGLDAMTDALVNTTDAIETITDAVSGSAEAVGNFFDAIDIDPELQPLLGSIGIAIGAIAVASIAASIGVSGFTAALTANPIVTFGVAAVAAYEILQKFPILLPVVAAGMIALTLAMDTNPVLAFASAFVVLAGAADDFGRAAFDALKAVNVADPIGFFNDTEEVAGGVEHLTDVTGDMSAAFADAATQADTVQAQFAIVRTSLLETLSASQDFKDSGLADAVAQLGLNSTELTNAIGGSRDEFLSFVIATNDAKNTMVTLNGEQVRLSDALRSGQVSLDDYASGTLELDDAGTKLRQGLFNTRNALDTQIRGQLDAAVSTGALTQSQLDAADGAHTGALGYRDNVAVLEELAPLIDVNTKLIKEQTVAQFASNDVIQTAIANYAAGVIGADEFSKVLQQQGVDAADVANIIPLVTQAVDNMTAAFVSKLPTATSVWNDLGDEMSPQNFIDSLNANAQLIKDFTAELEEFSKKGLGNVAAFAASLGPQAGIEFLASLNTEGLQQETDDAIGNLNEQTDTAAETFAKEIAPILIDAFKSAVTVLGKALGLTDAEIAKITSAGEDVGTTAASGVNQAYKNELNINGDTDAAFAETNTNVPTSSAPVGTTGAGSVNQAYRNELNINGITTGHITDTAGVTNGAPIGSTAGFTASTAYDSALGFLGITQGQIDGANTTASNNEGGTYSSFHSLGNAAADGFDAALGRLASIATGRMGEAISAAQARLEVNSPSKAFMALGDSASEGFALGFSNVVGEVEGITGELIDAAAQGFPANGLTSASLSSTTGTTFQSGDSYLVQISVENGTTPEHALEVGRLVGDGFATAVASRRVATNIRSGGVR